MVDRLEVGLEAVEAFAGQARRRNLEQHRLEEVPLSVVLEVGEASFKPLEAEVSVEGDGARIGDQGLPDLLTAAPREVKVALLEEELHEVEMPPDVLLVSVAAVDNCVRLKRLKVGLLGDLVGVAKRVAEQLDDAVLLVQIAQRGLVSLGVDGRALGVTLADLVQVVDRRQNADAVSLDVLDALVNVGLAICILVLEKS